MLRFTATRATRRDDSVLIVHGLTTSTDMFIMPEHNNLVSYLLDHGYTRRLVPRLPDEQPALLQPVPAPLHDGRHRAVRLSAGARHDPPARRRPAHPRHRHCLGSVSFMMSLFGKAVTGITSVIANSVALTPRVPRWSKRQAARSAPALVENVLGFPYLNPRWSDDPALTRGKLFSQGRVVLPPRVRRAGLPHAEPDVGHGLAGALQPRQPGRRHAPPRRRPVRRDEHALLPARPEDGRARAAGREVRHGQPGARLAAGRLLRVRARTSRRRCC